VLGFNVIFVPVFPHLGHEVSFLKVFFFLETKAFVSPQGGVYFADIAVRIHNF